jgi:hypothetical protein
MSDITFSLKSSPGAALRRAPLLVSLTLALLRVLRNTCSVFCVDKFPEVYDEPKAGARISGSRAKRRTVAK